MAKTMEVMFVQKNGGDVHGDGYFDGSGDCCNVGGSAEEWDEG